MRNITITLILTLLFAIHAEARDKRALIIGIGKQEDTSWSTIHGDRDVAIISDMLSKSGFSDITTLKNEKATKAAIVSGIKDITSRCKTGDVVYIHFSGHGQRMTDLDGDETNDGYDEAWIPYDAYRQYCAKDHGEKHLSDDELSELLTAMRNKVGEEGNIVVVVDACHSGDSTRGSDDEDTVYVRGVRDTFEIPCKAKGTAQPHKEQWLTLSACKDYQLNQEHRNGYGKLSYAVYTLYGNMASMTNDRVISAVNQYMQRSDVSAGHMTQTPVLTGEKNKYAFNEIFK